MPVIEIDGKFIWAATRIRYPDASIFANFGWIKLATNSCLVSERQRRNGTHLWLKQKYRIASLKMDAIKWKSNNYPHSFVPCETTTTLFSDRLQENIQLTRLEEGRRQSFRPQPVPTAGSLQIVWEHLMRAAATKNKKEETESRMKISENLQ